MELKILSKKGIFFTFIAITIMAVFILVFTPQADISLQKDERSVRTRINSIDHYVNDLEKGYFEAALRASTYKTILSLIFYMNTTGHYLTDLDSAFSEVILNGTINKVPIDSVTGKKIMENSTLTNWTNKIIETAKDTLNVNTTIKVNDISVFQTKPWNIDSTISVNFTVKSNIVEWKKESIISATIGLEGFHDPYYLVNTNRAYTNQITKSSLDFNQWNLSQAREHLRNGTYLHWQNSDAPSFLMRFTNTTTNSSCCGIESLVNPNKINPSDQIESYADYLFWSHKFARNCTQLYNVTGLWDEFKYFKLDFEHVIKYNITGQYVIRTC
jgi:hypothetical protein